MSQLLTIRASLPISRWCLHRVHTHTFLCVCSEWLCIGMWAESSPYFFYNVLMLLSFFWTNLFIILFATSLSTVSLWLKKEKVSGVSEVKIWNTQMQALHINLLETSSNWIFSPRQTLSTSVSVLLRWSFWQNDEVRWRLRARMKVNLHFQYFVACEWVRRCFVKAVRYGW